MNSIQKKVLIIEDSPVQAQALQRFLEEYGLRVLSAPDGRVGVQLAEQWLPDVIVLDIQMPNMNGFEVCEYLRDNPNTDHIPIIILTVHNELSKFKKSILLGAIDFIPKDEFTNVVLLKTLHQLQLLDVSLDTDQLGLLDQESKAFSEEKVV